MRPGGQAALKNEHFRLVVRKVSLVKKNNHFMQQITLKFNTTQLN